MHLLISFPFVYIFSPIYFFIDNKVSANSFFLNCSYICCVLIFSFKNLHTQCLFYSDEHFKKAIWYQRIYNNIFPRKPVCPPVCIIPVPFPPRKNNDTVRPRGTWSMCPKKNRVPRNRLSWGLLLFTRVSKSEKNRVSWG